MSEYSDYSIGEAVSMIDVEAVFQGAKRQERNIRTIGSEVWFGGVE